MRKQEIMELCSPLKKEKKISLLLLFLERGWSEYDQATLAQCTRDIEFDEFKVDIKKALKLGKDEIIKVLLKNDEKILQEESDDYLLEEIFSYQEYNGENVFSDYFRQVS